MSEEKRLWSESESEGAYGEPEDLIPKSEESVAEAEEQAAELADVVAETTAEIEELASEVDIASGRDVLEETWSGEEESLNLPPSEPAASGGEIPRHEMSPLPALSKGPSANRGAESTAETGSDDRLIGALAWASTVLLQLPILPAVLLFAEANRSRPFQRYHSVTSLVFWGVALLYEVLAIIVYTILTVISLGCLGLLLWVIFFVPHLAMLYYAYQAYQGKTPEIPFVSDFARKQRWL